MAKALARPSASELRHTDGKYIRIGELLYVRNGRLYGIKTVKGKMVRKVAPIQGLEAVDGRGRPTAAAKKWVRTWGDALESADYFEAQRKAKVPTLGELLRAYEGFAAVEYELNHTPMPSYTSKVRFSFLHVLRVCGLAEGDRATELTRARLDAFVEDALGRGTRPISVFGALAQAKAVYSRWAMERYAAKGWEVPKPDFPRRRGKHLDKRYQRPPEALRARTMEWYRGLEAKDPMRWAAASLMLQFAMRNGDATRLRWQDITFENDRWVLVYLPQKTTTSSGRWARAAMDVGFYDRLRAAGGKGERVLEHGEELFVRINKDLREIGWDRETYSKVSYELRKMCIDRIYRTFGAEAAVQVSGDDIKTVVRYYADPSRACMETMNVQ